MHVEPDLLCGMYAGHGIKLLPVDHCDRQHPGSALVGPGLHIECEQLASSERKVTVGQSHKQMRSASRLSTREGLLP